MAAFGGHKNDDDVDALLRENKRTYFRSYDACGS